MYKTNLLRLESVVPHGVGGPGAGAISLIYTYLLQKYQQDIYSHIQINQIGQDLDELIVRKSGNGIHVNIRYPAEEKFELQNEENQNLTRLAIIHEALLRIAAFDSKLDKVRIQEIKNEILSNNFSFEFIYKEFINKIHNEWKARIVVKPEIKEFIYFVVIENEGSIKCKMKIYSGGTDLYYLSSFFEYGKWKSEKEFVLTGTKKEIELHVYIDKSEFKTINLTAYPHPPFFQLMRTDITLEEKNKAYEDWIHSLPPSGASFLSNGPN